MKYDFETMLDRRGRDALAFDALGEDHVPGKPKGDFSILPMWVADMNFKAAPSIIDAIEKRLSHPVFGYFSASDEYFDSIISWQKKRNGVTVARDDIGYENGVLGCLASAIRAFTSPGEAVLVHSPTYVGFLRTISSLGRRVEKSALCRDASGVWRMNYDDIENVIKENSIHFAVFCSPHNPTGRVWEKDEILRFIEICEKYDVTVFSDEIWSDIILDGGKFIPTHSVSADARARTITAYAPSKTFNLAGLIGSYHVVFDKKLHDRLKAESAITHYNSMNVLSQHALIGAYGDDGTEWADELCIVLSENVRFAYEHIKQNYPGVDLAKPQGTYMLYIDLTKYLEASGKTADDVLRSGWDVGVAWQDGRPFGADNSIRINLAMPTAKVKEAFERLDRYVFGVK